MYITYNKILQLQLFSRSLIIYLQDDNIYTKPGIRKLLVLKNKKQNLSPPGLDKRQ